MKIILLGLFGLFGLLIFCYTKSLEIQENFISSDSFNGSKKGYVFKNCSKGLGYYKDILN
jgi:hypothetical protein